MKLKRYKDFKKIDESYRYDGNWDDMKDDLIDHEGWTEDEDGISIYKIDMNDEDEETKCVVTTGEDNDLEVTLYNSEDEEINFGSFDGEGFGAGELSDEIWSCLNESLNESVLQKDLDRMESILKKSDGDKDKVRMYSKNMANAIKDKHKAHQRGLAAIEVLKDKESAKFFFDKANELGLDVNLNLAMSHKTMDRFGLGIEVPKLGSKKGKTNKTSSSHSFHRPSPILPIGSVNLQNGESKYFNVIENGKYGGSVVEIWKDYKDNLKMIITSGKTPINDIGDKGDFIHDQTGSMIGHNWEMVEWVNINDIGELMRVFNKKTIRGYVYK